MTVHFHSYILVHLIIEQSMLQQQPQHAFHLHVYINKSLLKIVF